MLICNKNYKIGKLKIFDRRILTKKLATNCLEKFEEY